MSRTTVRALLVVGTVVVVVGGFLVWQNRQDTGFDAWVTCDTEPAVPLPEVTDGAPIPGIGSETVLEAAFPTSLVEGPDGWLYVTEREGMLLAVPPDGGEVQTVVDLVGDVSLEGEQGLLTVTFSPDGTALYLDYTDADGDTTVAEYTVDGPGSVDESSARVVLQVDQTHRFHNGGGLAFGPDGYLYIGLGDGGDDLEPPDPEDDGQRLDSLHGSVLRIDPTPSGDAEYTVPEDNPFVDDPDAEPEIWARGVRNAWRLTFDPETDELWLPDVGHFCYEEVNVLTAADAGSNLGWSQFEGVYEFRPDEPIDTADFIWPIYQYDHASTSDDPNETESRLECAIIGGAVYHGEIFPELDGGYLFSDLCSGQPRALWRIDGGVEIREFGPDFDAVTSVSVTPEGEVYVLVPEGVERMVPA